MGIIRKHASPNKPSYAFFSAASKKTLRMKPRSSSVYDDMEYVEDSGDMMDYADTTFHDADAEAAIMTTPRAVHQCNIWLHQHAVIHTDQKPFGCDICGKTFRSVHSGFTPHACPFCGKTCRLKGNLKKHLKTHVTTKEELEDAWRPFASNRRPPQDIPDDAIIVRGSGEPIFAPPSRMRRKKLGLGNDPRGWIERIQRGELLATLSAEQKVARCHELLRTTLMDGLTALEIIESCRGMPFENFECPACKQMYCSLHECNEHISIMHPKIKSDKHYFCDICLKAFADTKSLEQHASYHKRVALMIAQNELEFHQPEMLVPEDATHVTMDGGYAVDSDYL